MFDNFIYIGRSLACNRRATHNITQVEAHTKAAGLLSFSRDTQGYHLCLKIAGGFRGDMQEICLKLKESFQKDMLLNVHDESW